MRVVFRICGNESPPGLQIRVVYALEVQIEPPKKSGLHDARPKREFIECSDSFHFAQFSFIIFYHFLVFFQSSRKFARRFVRITLATILANKLNKQSNLMGQVFSEEDVSCQ